jgi:hypothetical protein
MVEVGGYAPGPLSMSRTTDSTVICSTPKVRAISPMGMGES